MNYRAWIGIALIVALSAAGCSRESRARRAMDRGQKHLQNKDYARALLEFKNAAKATPLDPEPYYQIGLIQLHAGNPKAAYDAFLRATELNPRHAAAQSKLAELMSTSTDTSVLAEVEQRAHTAVELAPEDVTALNTLAIAQWKLGKKADAERHLEEAFRKFPRHLYTAVSLAKIRMDRGDTKGAEELLKKAAEQPPASADLTVALAEFYAMTRRYPDAERQYRRALELDPKNVSALLDLAALQVRSGQTDRAKETYRRLSLASRRHRTAYAGFLLESGYTAAATAELEELQRREPLNREVRTLRVQAYLAAGNTRESDRLLSSALAKNPKDTEAIYQRSLIDLENGRLDRAFDGLTQVIAVMPDFAEARFFLARAHQRRGNLESYQQQLTEALRLDPNFLPARVELSRLLISSKSLDAALDIMNRAPEPQKHSVAWMAQRNWALMALGKWTEARRAVDESLPAARTAELLRQSALLSLHRRDFAGARGAAREALEKNPEDIEALRLLARTYAEQRQAAAGIEAVKAYAASHHTSAPVRQFLGELLLAEGRRAEARDAFQSARSVNPRFAPASLSLARLELAGGKPEAARPFVSEVLASDANNNMARLLMGMVEEQAGHYREAVRWYRLVAEAEPLNAVAYNNLAYVMAAYEHNPDEALKYAERAKELQPYNATTADTLGWVLYQKGLYSRSVRVLEEAVARQPDARRRYHLAMAYARAGDRQRAVDTFNAALKQDAGLPEAEAARKVLAGQP
jgi:tetratricopeptide (TPR) repeat protein